MKHKRSDARVCLNYGGQLDLAAYEDHVSALGTLSGDLTDRALVVEKGRLVKYHTGGHIPMVDDGGKIAIDSTAAYFEPIETRPWARMGYTTEIVMGGTTESVARGLRSVFEQLDAPERINPPPVRIPLLDAFLVGKDYVWFSNRAGWDVAKQVAAEDFGWNLQERSYEGGRLLKWLSFRDRGGIIATQKGDAV